MTTRLILTHENADFDAVASLLAVYKLDPQAQPVLPQRVNRNVQNFLTLYAKGILPIIHASDLQRQRIEKAYVVDTQSFNLVKGMRPNTPIHYIDHHALDRPLDPHETFEGDPVGANTTFLVEQLREQAISLTAPEATLLILGIYEDTGSLTFGKTTVRDAYAAAWLLEKGASLDHVRKFLTYPLQDEQRPIYDELLETAEVLEIAGHAVLLATAHSDEDVPEISGLAHRLRDLYDPNAIVLAVQMRQHVQLVGRSSVDEIDIAAFARHFGGGGHSRASAALLRHTQLEDILPAIKSQLSAITKPSVRVRDLMSVGSIFTFSPDTTIGEAIDRTKHVNHEGYPIVQDRKVIGLLTRTALMRAQNHGMGWQKVQVVMDKGNVSVHPDDSLETLRQRMVEVGWGQMPVVDDQQFLVGIVTRTDLIRLWNEATLRANYHGGQLLDKLRASLPDDVWALVSAITAQAERLDVGVYLIGGFVRDLLLGVPNLDIDFVVEGNAIDFVEALCTTLGGEMRHHSQFNTAKWVIDDTVAERLGYPAIPPTWTTRLDFATARTEFYDEPTTLPTVRQSSIKLDLHRRDFTINAMAIRLAPEPSGELLDYYNGERDLADGLIRVLHSLSFVDDPTRMIRAIRFEQRLGFQIEARTIELFEAALPLIQRVSGDRLRNELNLIMAEPSPLRYFRRLAELGILGELHPALRVDGWFSAACKAVLYFRQYPQWPLSSGFDNWRVGMFAVLTARLTADELQALGAILSIGRTNLRHLATIRTTYQTLLALPPATAVSVLVEQLGGLDEVDWVVLWAILPYAYQRRWVEQFVMKWQYISPTLNGDDLIRLGVPIGPAVGQLLKVLRRGWLDGDIASPDDEHRLITQWIESDGY